MIEKLRAHPFFREVADDALETLASRLTRRTLAEGEVLFHEGDEGDAIYIVDDGELAIVKGGTTLAALRAGQVLGEMALFEKERRSADAVATEPTVVHAIRNDDMTAFLLEHPTCGAQFLFAASKELSRRLRISSEFLTTVFETGRIVGSGFGITEMSERILTRLLDDIGEATSGTILVYNPFGETYEIVGRAGPSKLDLEEAIEVLQQHKHQNMFQAQASAMILAVALKDARDDVLGYLWLEKEGDTRFTPQEEVVVGAVGQQTGLGILNAYGRQEDEARSRLERGRLRQEGL